MNNVKNIIKHDFNKIDQKKIITKLIKRIVPKFISKHYSISSSQTLKLTVTDLNSIHVSCKIYV